MTDRKEFNASDVEKALQRAATELGIEPGAVEYEVLDQGSDGFLGIGARDARILAVIPESLTIDTPSAEPARDPEPEPLDPEPAPQPELIEDPVESDDPSAADLTGVGEVEHTPKADISEEDLARVRNITESFVTAMGFQARIDVYETDDFVAADITSDHTALLIGQKGETLDSLQHLVNCAASQKSKFGSRIVLDSEGYRQRRIEAIQGMAHRTARRVAREGAEANLPPMPPTERRVVHLYLEDNAEVTTYSEGSGGNRHVVVAPA